MSNKEYLNSKSPKDAITEGKTTAEYPYAVGSSGPGTSNIFYCHPDDPNRHYLEEIYSDGSNKTILSLDGKETGLFSRMCNQIRNFCSGGKSVTTLGHNNNYNAQTVNNTTVGDVNDEIGGNKLTAAHNTVDVKVAGGVETIPLASTNDGYVYYSGTRTERYYQDFFTVVDEDRQEAVGGSKQQIVGKEYAVHVQNGNWDTLVEGGQAKFEVQNKIIFKVGTSTIVMEPDKITIDAKEIHLNP